MQDIASLPLFMAAAESLSFSKAGARLGLSPSAAGKAIARLEQQLGAKLFHRTTRRVRLSKAGELLYTRATTIRDEWAELRALLSEAQRTPRGRLRIAMPAIGHRLIAPHLAAFQRECPDVDLDLDQDDQTKDLIAEGIDLAIRGGPLEDSTHLSRRLGGFTFAFYATLDYVAARGTPTVPASLGGHDLVRLRAPGGETLQPWWIDGEAVEPAGRKRFTSTSMEGVLSAVLAGAGIAQMPSFLAREHVRTNEIVEVLPSRGREGEFWFVWPRTHRHSTLIQAFIEFLVPRFDEQAITLERRSASSRSTLSSPLTTRPAAAPPRRRPAPPAEG